MTIEFWMALVIIFMFMLLVYGLVHQNRFIIYSSILGIIVYFIVLQPVLTSGGSIKKNQLKEEWEEIQVKSGGDYAEHLTLFKTTFAHNERMTEQLTYYEFALSYHDELLLAIVDEKGIITTYDRAFHNTLMEKISFYEKLLEQHHAVQLPKDDRYEEVHEAFKKVVSNLQELNANNESLQSYLEPVKLAENKFTEKEQQEVIVQYTDKQTKALSSLHLNQTQLDKQVKNLTSHIEWVISYQLNSKFEIQSSSNHEED